jgi:hypothetical protein
MQHPTWCGTKPHFHQAIHLQCMHSKGELQVPLLTVCQLGKRHILTHIIQPYILHFTPSCCSDLIMLHAALGRSFFLHSNSDTLNLLCSMTARSDCKWVESLHTDYSSCSAGRPTKSAWLNSRLVCNKLRISLSVKSS